jgi:uncharacterized membrane protein YphA (DoxX/SURF4 family)
MPTHARDGRQASVRARWGGIALVAFLAPVTVMMHNFWAVTDPMMQQMQL